MRIIAFSIFGNDIFVDQVPKYVFGTMLAILFAISPAGQLLYR